MGDPKHQRKKYSTPAHPWQRARMEIEKPLLKDFGLKNKRELWKMNSLLSSFTRQAKRLIAEKTEQAALESRQLLKKLHGLGLVGETASLSEVLNLTIQDVLERRLQTRVFRKGYARSIDQARQFIIHKHIQLVDQRITAPSYLVHTAEEEKIAFVPYSSLASPTHVERIALVKKGKKHGAPR